MGTSLAEAGQLDPPALVVMDLAARAAGPRRDERVLALREEYAPVLREARVAVVHAIGTAADLARRPRSRPGAVACLAEAGLRAAPLVVALSALGFGAPLFAAAALAVVLWAAARPAVARLERGPVYAHGCPRVTRAAAKFLLGDLIDAHASELLEHAGAPAADVVALRRRWSHGMSAVLAWRSAVGAHDAGPEPRR